MPGHNQSRTVDRVILGGLVGAVKLDALPGRVFKGKLARLAGALDPAKRTLRAEIDLPNPDGRLLPGMYGTATLMLGRD